MEKLREIETSSILLNTSVEEHKEKFFSLLTRRRYRLKKDQEGVERRIDRIVKHTNGTYLVTTTVFTKSIMNLQHTFPGISTYEASIESFLASLPNIVWLGYG